METLLAPEVCQETLLPNYKTLRGERWNAFSCVRPRMHSSGRPAPSGPDPLQRSTGRLSYGGAGILSLTGLTGSWFGRQSEHSTYLNVLFVSVASLWS